MRQQIGFTLLELMVAMAIFAMLAVAGWQVFDSVNRAHERAQVHADNLAQLQYAYLQLQHDMGQMIAYQAPPTQNVVTEMELTVAPNLNTNNTENSNVKNNDNSSDNQRTGQVAAAPFMSLNNEQVSFVRFADPDPRYQTSPTLQRVDYIFADERLIRRHYHDIAGGPESVSLDTVLLDEVRPGAWRAYLPEESSTFPNKDNLQGKKDNVINTNNSNQEQIALPQLLPKGIGVSFTYQGLPITWQWALSPQAVPHTSSKNSNS